MGPGRKQMWKAFLNALDSVLENPNSCELRAISFCPSVRYWIDISASCFQHMWSKNLPLLSGPMKDRLGEGHYYEILSLQFIQTEEKSSSQNPTAHASGLPASTWRLQRLSLMIEMPTAGRWDGARQLFAQSRSVETLELNNGDGPAACKYHDESLDNWDLVSVLAYLCATLKTWISDSLYRIASQIFSAFYKICVRYP